MNYGTALLKRRVMRADGVTTLLDNNQGLHPSEQPNKVNPLPSGANRGLVITGIVIGGQPNSVCWDYTRASSDSLTVWKWVPTNDNNPNDSGYYTKYDGSPVEFENNGFDYMIYDKVFEQKVSSSTSSETTTAATTKPITVVPYNSSDLVPIYTMCWDNYDASKAEQNNVFFAVELRNETGADFWGELNLVRKGGTFYLVGNAFSDACDPRNHV